ncbi:hypothetical protein pb186bvf_005364 [Paramecium bursaria]
MKRILQKSNNRKIIRQNNRSNILIIPQSQILKPSIDLGYKLIINMGVSNQKIIFYLTIKLIGLYEIFLRSKIPNYKALQFPYPFQPNSEIIQGLFPFILHERAIKFQPTNVDLEQLNKGINKIEVKVLDIKMPKIHNCLLFDLSQKNYKITINNQFYQFFINFILFFLLFREYIFLILAEFIYRKMAQQYQQIYGTLMQTPINLV